MNLKTGILAAVAALTLAAPAAALAQPYYYGYGDAPRYADRDWRRDEWRREEARREHWRHEEREREFRRDRAYGDYGRDYGRYGYGYSYGYSHYR